MAELEEDVINMDESIDETPEEITDEEVTLDDYKALQARLRKAEAKIVENKKKEKEVKSEPVTKIDTELRLFLVENPEAKEFKEKILELKSMDKYKNLELEDLLDLAKIKTLPESKTKTNYDFRSLQKPKTLESMSEEEAVDKLSPAEFLKWSRAN
jgi:hypothetical protein